MCVTEPDFWRKKIAPKMGKINQKMGFFQFIEKLRHYFFLNLIHNESFYYLLNSYIYPISGKNLVSEICAKISITK